MRSSSGTSAWKACSGITAGTVFNYLPIQVGDTVDGTRTAGAVRALFQTGFFRDVRLERDGETLVVSVVERPSIGSIEFSGNEDLKTEDLMSALEQIGFAQGRVFNRSIFDQVEQELHRTYFAAGKYGARVTGTVTPLERNRVAVRFEISEGVVAKIRQINIVGNAAFDDDDLLDDFELETTGFFSFFSRSDRYSKPKLGGPTSRRCVHSISTRASSTSTSTPPRSRSRPTRKMSTSPSTSPRGAATSYGTSIFRAP